MAHMQPQQGGGGVQMQPMPGGGAAVAAPSPSAAAAPTAVPTATGVAASAIPPRMRGAALGSQTLGDVSELKGYRVCDQLPYYRKSSRRRIELKHYWMWAKYQHDLIGIFYARPHHKFSRQKRILRWIFIVWLLLLFSVLTDVVEANCIDRERCLSKCKDENPTCDAVTGECFCTSALQWDREDWYVWPKADVVSDRWETCLENKAPKDTEMCMMYCRDAADDTFTERPLCSSLSATEREYALCMAPQTCTGIGVSIVWAFVSALFVIPCRYLSYKIFTCYWCKGHTLRSTARRCGTSIILAATLIVMVITIVFLTTLPAAHMVLITWCFSYLFKETLELIKLYGKFVFFGHRGKIHQSTDVVEYINGIINRPPDVETEEDKKAKRAGTPAPRTPQQAPPQQHIPAPQQQPQQPHQHQQPHHQQQQHQQQHQQVPAATAAPAPALAPLSYAHTPVGGAAPSPPAGQQPQYAAQGAQTQFHAQPPSPGHATPAGAAPSLTPFH